MRAREGAGPLALRGRARGAAHASLALALAALALTACNLHNEGISPPEGKISYPIALRLSRATNEQGAPKYLYVANTNFDLKYNGASVHSYDLDQLDELLEGPSGHHCRLYEEGSASDAGGADAGPADAGLDAQADAGGVDAGDAAPDADAALDASGLSDAELADAEAGTPAVVIAPVVPGADVSVLSPETRRGRLCDNRYSALDGKQSDPEDEKVCCFGARSVLDKLRVGQVFTDSYAAGMATLASRSGSDEYLYVAVRSRNKLIYVHADPSTGALDCGSDEGRCQRGPGISTKLERNGETEHFAPQPSAVTAGAFSDLGIASERFRNFVATAHDTGDVSLFGVTGAGEPKLLDVAIAAGLRTTSLHVDGASQFLYAGSVGAQSIERIGVRFGPENSDQAATPLVYRAEALPLTGLTGTQDVRDVQLDTRPREAGAPLRAYALVRGASSTFLQSVVFVELDARTNDGRFARVIDAVRVGSGPSKLTQADLDGRHLLFASCYEAGEIHVIDADKRQTVGVIRDVLGPFDMQVDVARQLLYVTDFRTSSLRVIELRGLSLRSAESPVVIATLGVPTTPGSIR